MGGMYAHRWARAPAGHVSRYIRQMLRPFRSRQGPPRPEGGRTTIAIFGAGAIGCWVGGKLAAGGARITLIGRPRVLDELTAHGLTVSELDGEARRLAASTTPPTSTSPAVHVTTDPAAAAGAAIVLVTVKSAQTAEAGATLAGVVGEDVAVVSLQNGVRNAEALASALGRPALAGMVPWNVVRRGPGAYHRGSSGTLVIERAARAEVLYAALAAAGLGFATRDDMPAVQWAKLVMNLNNAINALSGKPLAAELAERAYRRCLAASQREAIALLDAAGQRLAKLTRVPPRWMPRLLELPDAVFRRVARGAIAIDPHARSSMQDDLEAGRPTEIAYLQGELVALAARLDRPAPVNAALVELVRAAEGGGRRDFSGDELAAAIAAAAAR